MFDPESVVSPSCYGLGVRRLWREPVTPFAGCNPGSWIWGRHLVKAVAVSFGLLASAACSDSESAPSECTLPSDTRFTLTEVELDESRSNAACPEFTASEWDTQALIEQGACEQQTVDCIVELTCEYEGLDVLGRLADRGGQVKGRLDVESPFVCIYDVEGEWGARGSDAGG